MTSPAAMYWSAQGGGLASYTTGERATGDA